MATDTTDEAIEAIAFPSEMSFSLMILGNALLISTVVQAVKYEMTFYHALIVLNLSWLNNVAASASLWFVYHHAISLVDNPAKGFYYTMRKHPGYLLYLIHFCATGAIGLWVWRQPTTFGSQTECVPTIFYWFFGHNVPVTSPSFRGFWLGVYVMTLIPFLGLVVVFLALACILLAWILIALIILVLTAIVCKPIQLWPINRMGVSEVHPVLKFYYLLFFLAPDILLIISTEKFIALNSVEEEESHWTFGQTVALLVTIIPASAFWKQIKLAWKRRNKRRAAKLEQQVDHEQVHYTSVHPSSPNYNGIPMNRVNY